MVEKVEVIKNTDSETIISNVRVYTDEKLSDLDKLDGLEIKAIRQHKSLVDNDVIGYTYYL